MKRNIKNFLMLLLMTVAGTSTASAQITGSDSTHVTRWKDRDIYGRNVEHEIWYRPAECFESENPIVIKAGPSLVGGNLGRDTYIGYDVSVGMMFGGFSGRNGGTKVFYMPEIGVSSRGFSRDEDLVKEPYNPNLYEQKKHYIDYSAHSIKLEPLQFGINWVNGPFALDAHCGAFASFDYTHSFEDDTYYPLKEDLDDMFETNALDYGVNIGVALYCYRFFLDMTYQRGFGNMLKDYKSKCNYYLFRLGIYI